MSDNNIYERVDGKYRKVGIQWRGFPADGVWLVSGKRDSKTCIMQIDDVKNVHLPSYARLMLERDRVISELLKAEKDKEKYPLGFSWSTIYEVFATALAEGHEPFDEENDEQRLINNL